MTFTDPEFGEVVIRKSAWSTNPKFSVSTSGKLTISGPKHTTVFLAKRWLNASRKQIREKLPIKDCIREATCYANMVLKDYDIS